MPTKRFLGREADDFVVGLGAGRVDLMGKVEWLVRRYGRDEREEDLRSCFGRHGEGGKEDEDGRWVELSFFARKEGTEVGAVRGVM